MRGADSQRSREAHPRDRDILPKPGDNATSSSYSTTPEQPSFFTIPQSSVPRRSSSANHARNTSKGHARSASVRAVPPSAAPSYVAITVPNRGQSRSPVKETRLRLDPITADAARRVPSQTQMRSLCNSDVLESPTYKHPRVKVEMQLSAPLFVGGGTLEGSVKVVVDDNERIKQRASLGIASITVDLLGYEEVSSGRKAIFLALGTELLDANHPPPANMVIPGHPLTPGDNLWTLSPSVSTLPFMLSLPLLTGPPPFQSKQGSIRFLICATAVIRDAGKFYRVRSSQGVHVLPTFDPEKALTLLPSPLTASDELYIPKHGGFESIKVTAGLHRHVWVSGSSVFLDVHIANRSRKPIRTLDLILERNILSYKHAAAATKERPAGQARIFESNHQSPIAKTTLKPGSHGWNGVEPHSSSTRTCELELPRGHATVISCKFFEVAFSLNIVVSVSSSSTKVVSLQLPITLIHMNSLDVVPNSMAQVAAAMEETRSHRHQRRRSSEARPCARAPLRSRSVSSPARERSVRRQPSYTAGRAFAAPWQQSLERQRAEQANIDDLRHALDRSPRKQRLAPLQGLALRKVGSNISFRNFGLDGRNSPMRDAFKAMTFTTPPGLKRREASSEEKSSGSFTDKVNRMRSFAARHDSRPPSRAHGRGRSRTENLPPPVFTSTSIAPHALGLSSAAVEAPIGYHHAHLAIRSATATGTREKLDRSRFEFKAVRRKASGSIKEKGLQWWEGVRHEKDREREGWI